MKTISGARVAAAIAAFVMLGTSAGELVTAQGRGGRGAAPATGTVEKIIVHGKSREGNREGD
ncbi:hypothetical protein B4Q13_20375, partial [Lacticaseibacillus rhamnosus]